jgi:hypothetical protein
MSALDLRVDVGHPLVRAGLALYPLFGDGPVALTTCPGSLHPPPARWSSSSGRTNPRCRSWP